MPAFHKQYGNTEGPLGLPMNDGQAVMVDAILRNLPAEDRKLKHAVVAKAPSELLDGERADVSWISTEDIDTDREIVLSRGMNDAAFKQNPVVTLNHNYYAPAIGRSLWRKRVKDGTTVGIKAKTQYPAQPTDWPSEQIWTPNTVFAQVKAGLLNGKSIGFIVIEKHVPSSHEIAARPELANVRCIIDKWMLLEYAVCTLGANPAAVVETVSKTRIAFTPYEEIVRHAQARVTGLDYGQMTTLAVEEALNRHRGRV